MGGRLRKMGRATLAMAAMSGPKAKAAELASYNAQPHRTEPHSHSQDWLAHLPRAGLRAMCGWERYCA